MIRKEAGFGQSRLGTAMRVPVATGEATREWTQVLPLDSDGEALLQPGALVIYEGNERVNPMRPVRVSEEILQYEEEETGPPDDTEADR